MPIRDGRLRFGYDGDRGLGERLIGEVLAGVKTATCMPLLEYDPALLSETRESVGSTVDLVDARLQVRARIRVRAVYDTVGHDLDPGMLAGEGYGDDAAAFLAEHVAGRHPDLAASDGDRSRRALDPLPDALAAVVALHDLAGFSLEEIAELLARPTREIRAELRRGRVRMAVGGEEQTTCRTARGAIADRSGASAAVATHLATCERCQLLQQRLSRARAGESVDDYQSLSEELQISRLLGRDAILNTVFVVTEFELA